MCVFALACLPLAYRFASCQKFRHLDPSSKFMASKTFAFLKNWTELEIPKSSNFGFFENLDFSLGGALINVFMNGYSFGLYFEEVGFVLPQKSGHNQFFSALYVYRTPLIFYESRGIFERSQILGVGFPQICSNFRICFGFYFYGLFHSQSSQRGIS